MSYVRENGLVRARRRRERRSIAILVFSGLLVLGAIVFAAAFMARPSDQAGACSGTTTKVAAPQSKFVLNVYNAGGKKGAASTAADALRSHQFDVGVIANDPYRKTITNAGEVRFGPDGAEDAKQFVTQYAPGAKLVEDGRDGDSVDVVVGPKFQDIKPAPPQPSAEASCKPSASASS